MKVEFVEPFVKAARDVFQLMMDLDVRRGGLRASEELIPSKDASVAIAVTGDLLGSILYSFPKQMTLDMVEIMAECQWKKWTVLSFPHLGRSPISSAAMP